MEKTKKAVGYILLSFNEHVDINNGMFDEDGIELPCYIVNIAHHIEVRFSDVQSMCDALSRARKTRSFEFLVTQKEAKQAIRNKLLIMSNIVVDQRSYKEFREHLDKNVYEKYRGSFVQSGKIDLKIDNLDFVENSHLDTSNIVKDFEEFANGIKDILYMRRVDMSNFEAVKAKLLFTANSLKITPVNIEDFTEVTSVIDWECKNGHTFTKGYKDIVQQKDKTVNICPHCRTNRRGEKMLQGVRDFAEANMLTVDTENYITANSKLKWVCKCCGNPHLSSYSSKSKGVYACRKCKRKMV